MNAPAALRRRLDYAGPALFSYGFRPFFLGAAVWAALAIALWLPHYFGHVKVPTAFAPLDWHIHEMIYGYVAAAVPAFFSRQFPTGPGGFRLTAIRWRRYSRSGCLDGSPLPAPPSAAFCSRRWSMSLFF